MGIIGGGLFAVVPGGIFPFCPKLGTADKRSDNVHNTIIFLIISSGVFWICSSRAMANHAIFCPVSVQKISKIIISGQILST